MLPAVQASPAVAGHAGGEPVLEYSSGSFTDFIFSSDPALDDVGPGGEGCPGPGSATPGELATPAEVAGSAEVAGPAELATPGELAGPAEVAGPPAAVPGPAGLDRAGQLRNGGAGVTGTHPMGLSAAFVPSKGGSSTQPLEPVHATSPKPGSWPAARPDLLVSLPPFGREAAKAPPAEEPAPRRRSRWPVIAVVLVVLAGGGTAGALTLVHRHSPRPLAATPSPRPNSATASASAPASPAASAAPTGSPSGLPAGVPGWTAPVPIAQPALHSGGAFITGISCPRPTTCYAVDSAGDVLVSTVLSATSLSSWHVVAHDPTNGLVAISCPTTGFCLAVDKSGYAVTLSHGTWSSPALADALPGTFTGVSCPSPVFCMAADSGGNAFAYTAASNAWQPYTVDTGGGGLTGVSCPSVSSCTAVDTGGGTYTFDGTSWSAASPVDVGHAFTAVSCASPAFCVAADANGDAAIFAGGKWTVGPMGMNAGTVACPGDGFCLATDGSGGVVTYHDGAWSTVTRIDRTSAVDALSCPALTACTAADRSGNILYYAPPPG
jgi:hypothetical protein